MRVGGSVSRFDPPGLRQSRRVMRKYSSNFLGIGGQVRVSRSRMLTRIGACTSLDLSIPCSIRMSRHSLTYDAYGAGSSYLLGSPENRWVWIIRTSSAETRINLLLVFCIMVFSHWTLAFIHALLNNNERNSCFKRMFLMPCQYSAIQSHTSYTNWAELQLQSQFRIRGLV